LVWSAAIDRRFCFVCFFAQRESNDLPPAEMRELPRDISAPVVPRK
jgi:hypothetical protein